MSVTPVMASPSTDLSNPKNYPSDIIAYASFVIDAQSKIPNGYNSSVGSDFSVVHGNFITGSSTAVSIQSVDGTKPTDYKVAGSTFTYDNKGADHNFIQNTGVGLTGSVDGATVKGVSFIYNNGSWSSTVTDQNKVLEGIIGNGALVTNGSSNSVTGRSDIYNLSGEHNLIYTAGASLTNVANSRVTGDAFLVNNGGFSAISSAGASVTNASYANAVGSSLVINSGSNVKWSSSGVTIK